MLKMTFTWLINTAVLVNTEFKQLWAITKFAGIHSYTAGLEPQSSG